MKKANLALALAASGASMATGNFYDRMWQSNMQTAANFIDEKPRFGRKGNHKANARKSKRR